MSTSPPTGWICPVCERGCAPHTDKCQHCADRAMAERFLAHRQFKCTELQIVRDYVFAQHSISEIAEDHGLSKEAVRQRLLENGVEMRPVGDRFYIARNATKPPKPRAERVCGSGQVSGESPGRG